MDGSLLKDRFSNFHPTADQLAKIELLLSPSQPETASEDWVVIPMAAASNLLSHNYGAWSVDSLKRMTASYAQGGQLQLFDHDWHDTTDATGIVFDAELLHFSSPSPDMMARMVTESPDPLSDMEIVARDGLYRLILYTAVEASHPIVAAYRYGRLRSVSVGGFQSARFLCPLCSTLDNPVRFSDPECPHLMPDGSQKYNGNSFDAISSSRSTYAPYYIRDGFKRAIEVSITIDGNCPQAEVINNKTF